MSTFDSISRLRQLVVSKGIHARAIHGDRLTMAVVDLEPGAALPEHHHDNEQLGFVISGTFTIRIGTEKKQLQVGDTYSIPSHVPHEASAGPGGCTVLDVFAPIRSDWNGFASLDPAPGRWP